MFKLHLLLTFKWEIYYSLFIFLFRFLFILFLMFIRTYLQYINDYIHSGELVHVVQASQILFFSALPPIFFARIRFISLSYKNYTAGHHTRRITTRLTGKKTYKTCVTTVLHQGTLSDTLSMLIYTIFVSHIPHRKVSNIYTNNK